MKRKEGKKREGRGERQRHSVGKYTLSGVSTSEFCVILDELLRVPYVPVSSSVKCSPLQSYITGWESKKQGMYLLTCV